ncbi:1124_t:CDS:1, partial [Gigaspora rosea]
WLDNYGKLWLDKPYQHSAYLRKELTAMHERYIQDTRIHCCLFFISPTGHA